MTCGVQRSVLKMEAYMVPLSRAFVASSSYSSKEMAEFHKSRHGRTTEVTKMNVCRTSGNNKTKEMQVSKTGQENHEIQTGL